MNEVYISEAFEQAVQDTNRRRGIKRMIWEIVSNKGWVMNEFNLLAFMYANGAKKSDLHPIISRFKSMGILVYKLTSEGSLMDWSKAKGKGFEKFSVAEKEYYKESKGHGMKEVESLEAPILRAKVVKETETAVRKKAPRGLVN